MVLIFRKILLGVVFFFFKVNNCGEFATFIPVDGIEIFFDEFESSACEEGEGVVGKGHCSRGRCFMLDCVTCATWSTYYLIKAEHASKTTSSLGLEKFSVIYW